MNPVNQFIEIAPDCPLTEANVPQHKGEKTSIASIEYELLSSKPYGYTLEELKFATHVQHKQIPPAELKSHRKQLWDAYFSKPHACMRASPLTKQYGWGRIMMRTARLPSSLSIAWSISISSKTRTSRNMRPCAASEHRTAYVCRNRLKDERKKQQNN